MKKKFLTLKDIEDRIVDGKLELEKNIFLSFAVKDYLNEKNIKIVSQDKTTSRQKYCNKEILKDKIQENSISNIIERLLKKDFGIEELEKIKKVTKIVQEVLK